MKNLFTKYGYTPDKEAVDRSLNLIAQNLEKVVSNDVLKECFSIMDLTYRKSQFLCEGLSAVSASCVNLRLS